MDAVSPDAKRRPIGTYAGVEIEAVAWDAVGAQVDLSFGCIFTREVDDGALKGGLKDLDSALGGALVAWRTQGLFRAEELETLHVTRPPLRVSAHALMLIGLGDPDNFSPAVMERATRAACREAIRLGVNSAALAPGLLDSGLTPSMTAGTGEAMLAGLLSALGAGHRRPDAALGRDPRRGRAGHHRPPRRPRAGAGHPLDGALNLTQEGYATRPALKRWVFDAGDAHLDSVAASFRQAFDARRRSA